MIQIVARYPNDGKGLRRLITILLRKKLIESVDVLNYGKQYSLIENKVQKIEQKYLVFQLLGEKKDHLLLEIKKLDPKINIVTIL